MQGVLRATKRLIKFVNTSPPSFLDRCRIKMDLSKIDSARTIRLGIDPWYIRMSVMSSTGAKGSSIQSQAMDLRARAVTPSSAGT